MSKVKNYLSLIKFSHTIFAMPFALIGFFLGIEFIDDSTSIAPLKFLDKSVWLRSDQIDSDVKEVLINFILVILCMIFARSAAMAFNRYLDRSFDAKNPRTAIREIPTGIIKANNVLLFTIVNLKGRACPSNYSASASCVTEKNPLRLTLVLRRFEPSFGRCQRTIGWLTKHPVPQC